MKPPTPSSRSLIHIAALGFLGIANIPSFAAPPVDAVVVFNEIMYHPTDPTEAGEFIELHNQMGINVDLSDWEITGGVNYVFPDNTVIPGGGYLVIARTPALIAGSLGPWTGSLSNSGETLRLRDKNSRLLDEMTYGDSGDWPIGPDGGGVSLTKSYEETSSGEATHWTVSRQMGGTPGTTNFPPPPSSVTSKVISLQSNWKYNNTGADLGTAWKDSAYNESQVGWQTGQALFAYGNPTIYDDYLTPPSPVSGNQEITTVTIASKSSEATSGGQTRAAVNCINGSGLSNGTHTTSTVNTMWMTNGTVLTPNDPLPAQITFDLGSTQNLTAIHVWNLNEAGTAINRGAKTVEILVAATAGGTFTSAGTYTFNQASGLVTEAGQDIPFVSNGVRQIRFNITANWGSTSGYAGLSEVKFYNDQPALPTPPPVHRESMSSVLPNTGVNFDGTLITPGQRDPHYINTADSLGAYVQNGHPAWLGVDGLSQWTGSTPNGTDNVAAGTTTYRMNVDLTYWKKESAIISLMVAADNSFDRMRINGNLFTAPVGTSFAAYYGPYSVPASYLVNGNNIFELDWTNAGPGANPGGFRAKWDATAEPILTRTTLPNNPVTSYFRQKFTWNGNPSSTYALSLEHITDDGAVFYLNGQEILRSNLPAGVINSNTPATSAVNFPRFSGALSVPATAFVVGENTLAVELHQVSASDGDAVFGSTLTLTETPAQAAAPLPLAFNEVSSSTAGAGNFFAEIINNGGSSQSLTGCKILSSSGASYTFGSGTLVAGATLQITEATLGFRPLDGEKLFFISPGNAGVLDAVSIKNRDQARTTAGVWQTPNAATPGGANTFSIPNSIVINEIMYHHQSSYLPTGSTADPEEWVELYNRSGSSVDLGGWALHGGADFTFPVGTTIPAGGYLVVAQNKLALAAKFPAATIVGDWSGSLANNNDEVRLEDANGNTVNAVHYFSSGRWDERAGGGGGSLELKNPNMDNSIPESWSASDESSKSSWQTFTYSGLGSPPAGSNDPTQYNELIVSLLAGGECLVDDVSVIDQSDSNAQLIQDGTFSAGNTSKWRLLGTHGSHGRSGPVTEGVGTALKIVATGAAEHMHNHCETTLKNGASFVTLNSTHTYAISFRAKWLSGVPRLQTRLYFNRLNRQHLLPVPMNNGTPGAVNSKSISLPQPTFTGLNHAPVLPAAGVPVVVTATPSAAVPISSLTLKWQKDGVGTWTDVAMALNGNGQYEGSIPGQATGSLVQFYMSATATNGQTATFPAGGTASRAMIRWQNGVVPPGPGYGVRILLPTADADFMHSATNAMSNDFLPCTIVYRDSEVFYDAGVRLKSSERGRTGDPRLGFAITFDPTHKFRGVHETLNMDRSAYGQGTTGSGFGQVDIINQVFTQRAGGVPAMYNDMVYLITPRSTHTGSAQMTMAEYNDIYLDSQWDSGADSPTFKFDLVYFPTSTLGGTPEGLKQAQPDDVRGVNIGQLTGTSKEDYRWHYLISNARTDDDYSRIQYFDDALGLLAAGNSSLVSTAIDVDQWLRASAAMALVNSNDSYSTGGLPHNLKLYVRPTDGRVLYLPWDADFSKMDATYTVEGNADLQRIIAISPAYRRLYYGHLHDLMATSYNTGYLTSWVNHLKTYNTAGGNWQEILDYVAARVNFVQSDCATKFPNVPFSITTNGGNNFSSATSPVTLAGNGWINVREIRLTPTGEGLPTTWSGTSTWQIQVPLGVGANAFTLQAYDYQGALVGTDTITINNTGTAVAASATNVVISEFSYAPAAPNQTEINAGYTDPEDFEFIELRNISVSPVDLSQCIFDTGITYAFATGTTIAPNGYVIVPRRKAAFTLRYPGVPSLAEYYVLDANVLRNKGEELALRDAQGADIKRFTYNNAAPWPTAPASGGGTLVLISPTANPDHNDPFNWRASFAVLGNPGASDATSPPPNLLADDNQNGSTNLVDYATGNHSTPSFEGNLLSFTRNLSADVSWHWEWSTNMTNWQPLVDTLGSLRSSLGGSMEEISTAVAPTEARTFYRIRFSVP